MDRLSELPDERYLDLKQAAITSLLSKRWRFVWTDLPSLRFYETTGQIEGVKRFKAGVHATLASRRGAALKRLNFLFCYDKCMESDVDVWVELAAKNKVQQLNLGLYPSRFYRADTADHYTLHESMYSNSWLKVLHMQLCTVAPPTTVEWRSVTRISLSLCILPQQQIHNIVSGSPALTSLQLAGCHGFNRLEIGGRRFRSLGVDFKEEDGLLEISSPYMRSLNVDVSPKRGSLRLTNVVSLENIELKLWVNTVVDSVVMTNAYHVFRTISCAANTLVLGFGTLKVVSTMATNGWKLPQFKAQCMEIDADNDVLNIHGIIVILESSPFLESLRIHGGIPHGEFEFEEGIELEYPTPRCNLNCDLPHLKAIRIDVNVNVEDSCKSTFKLAQILLKRAPILEKMDIFKSKQRHFSPPTVLKDLVDKFETLFSYPKSSHKASVRVPGSPISHISMILSALGRALTVLLWASPKGLILMFR